MLLHKILFGIAGHFGAGNHYPFVQHSAQEVHLGYGPKGTSGIVYQKMPVTEGEGAFKTTVHMCTVVTLPQFQPSPFHDTEKCALELRWEDYQVREPAIRSRQYDCTICITAEFTGPNEYDELQGCSAKQGTQIIYRPFL